MKAILKRDKKKCTATITVTIDDITDFAEHILYLDMLKAIGEKFVEEYYADIIKRVDPKTLAAFITVEAAKKAVK